MKIVTYHGPESQRDVYLRVREVTTPDDVYGMHIVGVYPDEDTRPNPSKFEAWDAIMKRLFSRPLKKG